MECNTAANDPGQDGAVPTREILGARFALEITRLGLTRSEAALRLGVDKSTLSRICRGDEVAYRLLDKLDRWLVELGGEPGVLAGSDVLSAEAAEVLALMEAAPPDLRPAVVAAVRASLAVLLPE